MKPRFTPALCEFLEGNGWEIVIHESGDSTIRKDKQEIQVIQIIPIGIPEEDIQDHIKEMLKLAKTECTNG